MSIRYWLVGFIVLVFGFPASICLAHEPVTEPILGRAEAIGTLLLFTVIDEPGANEVSAIPILGPAEPIGALLLVASEVESEEPAPAGEYVGPIIIAGRPRLGRPVVLASLIPQELDLSSDSVPVDPNEIQERLREASRLLQVSGLAEESQTIQNIISKIEAEHFERLLLQKKESELAAIQAEVDRLRQSLGQIKEEPEVLLTVKFIESMIELPFGVNLDNADAYWKKIDDLRQAGTVKILCAPTLRVRSGQSGRFHCGGEIPNGAVSQAGGTIPREFGTTLEATPEVLKDNRVRLSIAAALEELDFESAVNGIPGISARRIQSTVEIESGKANVFGGIITTKNPDKPKETMRIQLLVAVTAEIIPAATPK